jgi:hypothetical protein
MSLLTMGVLIFKNKLKLRHQGLMKSEAVLARPPYSPTTVPIVLSIVSCKPESVDFHTSQNNLQPMGGWGSWAQEL